MVDEKYGYSFLDEDEVEEAAEEAEKKPEEVAEEGEVVE